MAIKTALGALRYNNRMDRIWAGAKALEAERLARGEKPNPNLTDVYELAGRRAGWERRGSHFTKAGVSIAYVDWAALCAGEGVAIEA